jgi:hypothetical protein
MQTIYTVAVQYDDTTDVLPVEFEDLQDAMDLRDNVVQEQETDPWDGLHYVYVIANGRVMI